MADHTLLIPLEPPPSGKIKTNNTWKHKKEYRNKQWDNKVNQKRIMRKITHHLKHLEDLNQNLGNQLQQLIVNQTKSERYHVREL